MTSGQGTGSGDDPSRGDVRRPDIESASILFAAAADPVRVRILAELGRGERTAASLGGLAAIGDGGPSALHIGLAELGRVGLIAGRRDGAETIYRLTGVGRAMADTIAELYDVGFSAG